MGTIGAFIFLIVGSFVGTLIGGLLGDPGAGGVMGALIVGFTCVIYYLDKPSNK